MSNYKFMNNWSQINYNSKQIYMLNKFHAEREKWDEKKLKQWNNKHNKFNLTEQELKQVSNIDTKRSRLNKRWENPEKMIITDEIREQCRKNRSLQKNTKEYTRAITTLRLIDEKGNNKTISEYSKKDFEDVYKWADEQVRTIKNNPIWKDRFQFAELHMDETNPHIHFEFLNYNKELEKFDTSIFWNKFEYEEYEINPLECIIKTSQGANEKFINSKKLNNNYKIVINENLTKGFKSVKQLKLQKDNFRKRKLTKEEIEIKRQKQDNCKFNCQIRKKNKELLKEQKELKESNKELLKEQMKQISNIEESNDILKKQIEEHNNLIEYNTKLLNLQKGQNQELRKLDNQIFLNKTIIESQRLEINNNNELIDYKDRNEAILNNLSQESYEEYKELEQQLLNNQTNNQGGQNE